mmetsp:Transcript_123817/g.361513  ORF Transcript_123817/g.361513 Transcript_123817/m.361513 type:complete len:233 (-) Transcript_123817:756-1454(-)
MRGKHLHNSLVAPRVVNAPLGRRPEGARRLRRRHVGIRDPLREQSQALGLVLRPEALGGPEGRVRHEVQRLQCVAWVKLVHQLRHDLADVNRCHLVVRVVIVEAHLHEKVGGERNWHAAIAQCVCDPASSGHVLRADECQVLRNSQGNLVPHPCRFHVPSHLRHPPREDPQHDRHEVGHGLVLDQLLHLVVLQLHVAAVVVLLHELFGLLALESRDRVELCHQLQVIHTDVP